MKRALSYDDVLLVPQKSNILSRGEISLLRTLGNQEYSLPIIASPMDTVTESKMSDAMSSSGALGIIHRYNTIKEQCEIVSSCTTPNLAAAIGVSGDYLKRAKQLVERGVKTLCVDVAHGHHTLMESALKVLKDTFGSQITIIAGNVATPEALCDLAHWGADAVRVGIGGGSICSTRIQTGHGQPTFQSVLDCRDASTSVSIIADGGIRTAGDIVKSLAAGADFVMLGSMLAGTQQAPGDVFTTNKNKKYKVYRGMASPEAQVDWRGEARSLEGVSTTIPFKGSVVPILDALKQNIRSGLSYSGARDITEFQAISKFIMQTASGIMESGTHIVGPKNGR